MLAAVGGVVLLGGIGVALAALGGQGQGRGGVPTTTPALAGQVVALPTATPTALPPSPTATATRTPVPSPTSTPTPRPTDTPTPEPTPTDTPVPTPTDTPVPRPPATPTARPLPTPTPTDTPVPAPTAVPAPEAPPPNTFTIVSFSPPAGTPLQRDRARRFEVTLRYAVSGDVRFGEIELCREPHENPRADYCHAFQTQRVNPGAGTLTLSGDVEVPGDKDAVVVYVRMFVQRPEEPSRTRSHEVALSWPTRI